MENIKTTVCMLLSIGFGYLFFTTGKLDITDLSQHALCFLSVVFMYASIYRLTTSFNKHINNEKK